MLMDKVTTRLFQEQMMSKILPFGKLDYQAFASSPSWYRKGDNQIVSGMLSSQSQTEPSDSATTTTPLRGDLSTRASPQFQLSQDFVKEIQVDHNSFKRETADSSISSKQQRMTVSEQAKNESPQLQHENDLGESKNETRLLRPKAKRHAHINHNSSKAGEIVKPSISNKQLPKQDKQRSKRTILTSRPSGNLQHSKRETPDRRPKDELEQFKSQTHYLRPRNKRYISVQRKLSKPEATAPVSSVSSKHEAKWNVEQCNTKTPNLKSGEGFEELNDEIPDREPTVKRHIEFHQSFIKPEGTISTSYESGRRQEKEDMKKSRKENPEIQTEAERDAQSKGVSTATVMTSAKDAAFSGQRMRVAASSYQPSHTSNHLGIPGLHTWTQGTSTPFQMPVQLPIGNSSQVPLPPFVPSLQPYPFATSWPDAS
ncbi:hypothetical protein M9H77_32943 [Catharanthus roseus]|uniref:Uncharacterized protein n=1 Tax=Catharanthus roseus TaxID=4058 RepID=A0ACC0A8B2_CATRO|nr:hypothetical protein M9H77_32943 [Catharanthus roseus]